MASSEILYRRPADPSDCCEFESESIERRSVFRYRLLVPKMFDHVWQCLLFVMVAVLATGCTNLNAVRDTLAMKRVATSQAADMTFTPLVVGQPHQFELTNDSPVSRFDGYKSYFNAFSLPPSQEGQSLRFHSGYWSGTRGNRGALRPRALFLDADKQKISSDTPAVFFRESGLRKGVNYTGRVRIPDKSQYVVIFSEPHSKDGKPVSLPIGFVDDDQSWPTGKLRIEVRNDQVATIADVVERETGRRARVFGVTSINGKREANARDETRAANSGAGFNLITIRTRLREIPVQNAKIGVMGTHMMGAGIHEAAARLAGTFFQVHGVVNLKAEPWVHYEVHGTLSEVDSTVWIERADIQKRVTVKLSTRVRDLQEKKELTKNPGTN